MKRSSKTSRKNGASKRTEAKSFVNDVEAIVNELISSNHINEWRKYWTNVFNCKNISYS